MKKLNSSLKSTLFVVSIVVLILYSAIFLLTGSLNSSQAEQPRIADVSFQGEYKIGEGEWRTVTPGEHIPADQGDVTLRGIFLMHNPETGEAIGPLPLNNTINLYFNHIGGTAILPGGGKIAFNAENAMLGEDSCDRQAEFSVCNA